MSSTRNLLKLLSGQQQKIPYAQFYREFLDEVNSLHNKLSGIESVHRSELAKKDIELMELDSKLRTFDERISMSSDQSDKQIIKALQTELINMVHVC